MSTQSSIGRIAHRTSRYIDAEVQGALLRRLVWHWAAFFACNAIGLVIWTRLIESPEASWTDSVRIAAAGSLPFFLISAALLPVFLLDTLKLTARFAGPMVRLKRALSDLRAGRSVSPLSFRGTDYWRQLADDFNAVVIDRRPPQ